MGRVKGEGRELRGHQPLQMFIKIEKKNSYSYINFYFSVGLFLCLLLHIFTVKVKYFECLVISFGMCDLISTVSLRTSPPLPRHGTGIHSV